ncbi:hypothetical protein, partial [Lysobacter sp. TAB13]|uniref:hypothetical protein n=1 Tax=Lysobacter sp. TAB13 TaxID=3233065 RepID=UPI003F9E6E31
ATPPARTARVPAARAAADVPAAAAARAAESATTRSGPRSAAGSVANKGRFGALLFFVGSPLCGLVTVIPAQAGIQGFTEA